MRFFILTWCVLLISCSYLPLKEPEESSNSPYRYIDYPDPVVNKTDCKAGRVRSIISGPDALVISVITDNGIATLRFPTSNPVSLTFPNNETFCYEYFDVGG